MRLTIGFVESPLRLKIVGGIDARIERRQKSARINGNQGGHGAVIARLEKIATDSEHGWQLVRRDAKRCPRRIVKIHLVDVAVRYGIVAIAIPFGIPARDAEGQLIVDERNGHRAFCQTHVVIADAKASITRKIAPWRSEEHTSELQSLMRISYAVFCLKKKKTTNQ